MTTALRILFTSLSMQALFAQSVQVLEHPTGETFEDLGFNTIAPQDIKDIPFFKFTSSERMLGNYQLMKDVHELFEQAGIIYWIECGTLLGAVRHQGIIPWDNDLDIEIDISQEANFLQLRDSLKKLGYSVLDMPYGYVVFSHYAGLDILITEEIDGRIMLQRPEVKNWWGRRGIHQIHFLVEEVHPRKLYKFGEMKVYGPNNPYPFLFANYGSDCLTMAFYQVFQGNNTYHPVGVELTKELCNPGMPTGPLRNRLTNTGEDIQ